MGPQRSALALQPRGARGGDTGAKVNLRTGGDLDRRIFRRRVTVANANKP
jgi:hypothetical protein